MRVVKLGGRVQESPDLIAAMAAAWHARPRPVSDGPARAAPAVRVAGLCIVHGGGHELSALQRGAGVEPIFVGGRRVTSAADLDFVRMVLSGLANKRLVSLLQQAGLPACGISGEDAGLLDARLLDAAVFGYAGTPARVRPQVVEVLLAAGLLPVVSPVARNEDGSGALNVNGDDAAAALAAALGATELLFVADVPGVLDTGGQPIPVLDVREARALLAAGVAGAGMAAKLQAAEAALAGGVTRVRIGGTDMLAQADAGTVVSAAPAEALV